MSKPPAKKFKQRRRKTFRRGESRAPRAWTELRIRRAELVKDNVTLPIQRLREAVSELIKTERRQGHRPGIGRVQPPARRIARGSGRFFWSQSADDHVYWVERAGKAQQKSFAQRRADRRGGFSAPPAL